MTGSVNTSNVCIQLLKLIILPQLIATLNNCTCICSLPPLANVNWSSFHSTCGDNLNSQNSGKMMQMGNGYGDLILLPLER